MTELRVVVADFWWGNEDQDGSAKFVRNNRLCRGLRERGFKLTLHHPASPDCKPDIAILGGFGPWFGYENRVDEYPDALKIFSCDENLYSDARFAGYRDHAHKFDYSFTYDLTTDRNFHIAGLRTADLLEKFSKPEAPDGSAAGEKSDFACFLYGNGAEEQDGVRLRNQFFRQLSAIRQVNSGGPVMNNMGGNVPYNRTGEFVSRHKFVLSMENTIHPGYVTEKILHGFIHGAVPVYCGAPDVHLLFNEKAFIRYTGDNFDEVLETVLRLDRDPAEYAKVLAAQKLPDSPRPEFRKGALDARIDAIAQEIGRRKR
jgi:hypothetical protein